MNGDRPVDAGVHGSTEALIADEGARSPQPSRPRRRSPPAPQALAALALCLVPAVLGGIYEWGYGATGVFMIPGVAVYWLFTVRAGRRSTTPTPPPLKLGLRLQYAAAALATALALLIAQYAAPYQWLAILGVVVIVERLSRLRERLTS